MTNSNNWFASWFNSPHYHTLYKNRDYQEAEFFLKNLTRYLQPKDQEKILDLACGAGRHSIFLNSLGYTVTGIDLSPNSIKKASQSANEFLDFAVHDMREVYQENEYNYVFNIFTSFGYFESNDENIKMLQSVKKSLKKGGIFVLDFFNSEKVIRELVKQEKKEIEGISYYLKRELVNGYIVKHIDFKDQGNSFSFKEKVQAISVSDFESLFMQAGLKIIATFGNYSLESFNPNKSDRLILIAKK